jgi:hypothetical protein
MDMNLLEALTTEETKKLYLEYKKTGKLKCEVSFDEISGGEASFLLIARFQAFVNLMCLVNPEFAEVWKNGTHEEKLKAIDALDKFEIPEGAFTKASADWHAKN